MIKLPRIMAIISMLLCLSSAWVSAQLSFERDSASEIADFMLSEHRRITKETIQLTDEEAKAFRPIFEDYQSALRDVLPKFAAFTKKLILAEVNRKSLSDEQADAIINDIFDAKLEMLTIQKSYMKKLRNVLPAKKVLLQVEVDEAITIAFRLKRLSEMPLVK